MIRRYILLLSGLIIAIIVGSKIYRVIFDPGSPSLISSLIFMEYWQLIALIFAVLGPHFLVRKPSLGSTLLGAVPAVLAIVVFMDILNVGRSDVHVVSAWLWLLLYASSLFVVLSDILLGGGAAYLTRVRGETWVKELDYLFLSLGALGVFGTLNQSDILRGITEAKELIGSAILATAIVVRLIKTRAEIRGWNKAIAESTPPLVKSFAGHRTR
jgi:hypothetical protein